MKFLAFKLPFFSNKKATPVRSTSAAPMSDILTGMFASLPVMRTWLQKDAVARIERDDQVISSLGSRKAATLKKELLITCENEFIVRALHVALSRNFINQLLDTPLQGMGTFELNWVEFEGEYWIPLIVERNYRDFIIKDYELRYDPVGSGIGDSIAPYKALHTLHNPKHNRPMGTALYDALYWPVKLKGASLGFWHKFLEKYGVPWAVGKTSGDREEMARELYNMLSGDAAVIDEDDTIETITTSKVGDFDKLVGYCDTQIAKVILGGNLTSEVKGGSFAAAQTHNDIRTDIAMTDEHIVLQAINDVLEAFKAINGLSIEITAELKDKDNPNLELAERDEKISNMGYTPTQEYIESKYNIKVTPTPRANSLRTNSTFAMSNKIPLDEIDRNLLKLSTREMEQELMHQLESTLDGVESFDEAIEALTSLYPDMKISMLENTLEKYMLNADFLGSAEIEDETGDDDASSA